MKEFIDGLLADETLCNGTKSIMLRDYERQWSERMATTTQSKEELEHHLGSLKIIQDAIEKVS